MTARTKWWVSVIVAFAAGGAVIQLLEMILKP